MKWTDVDGVAILAAHKGVPVKATIEHVRDGSSCRCVLHLLGLVGGVECVWGLESNVCCFVKLEVDDRWWMLWFYL